MADIFFTGNTSRDPYALHPVRLRQGITVAEMYLDLTCRRMILFSFNFYSLILLFSFS